VCVCVCVCMQVNLSHNKISFITRQTFPSSPWVPYRLREVDLSYNVMPVLTYDITVGTRRMEVLNVSHNILNEIRHSEYTLNEQHSIWELCYASYKTAQLRELSSFIHRYFTVDTQ
jgi:hypothetical protein